MKTVGKRREPPKLDIKVTFTEANDASDRLRHVFQILLASPPRESLDTSKDRRHKEDTSEGGK
jgi:hypothetical protein